MTILFPGKRLSNLSVLLLLCRALSILYLIALPMVTQAQVNASPPFEKMRALVVGVSDYRNEKVADLPFADDDASYFADLLMHQSEWAIDSQDIKLLINEEATYGNFIAQLNQLVEVSQPKDRVIIFFAGHGDVETVSDDKTGYLLFHDTSNKTYAAGGACEVNTLNQKISELTLKKGTQVFLITDACRSGSLAGSRVGGAQATTAALSTLFSNTVKLLSCQPDEYALEDKSLAGGHGLFSYFLVQGMLGDANVDDDAFVSLAELENYLKDKVLQASRDKQTPAIYGPKSLQVTRASRDNIAINSPVNDLSPEDRSRVTKANQEDTERFVGFTEAVNTGHLLFPKAGSAMAIYESMGDSPEAIAFRQIMKTTLIGELQKEAQRAISEYTSSPGKELAKRWVNSELYENYPIYLEKAAELLGTDDCFYRDIMSRAHYFKGVNLRLSVEINGVDESQLNLALAEQEKALEFLCTGSAPHVYNEIGLIYRDQEQQDLELSSFQKAVDQSPRWGLALTNLAYAYKRAGQFKKAERFYLQAAEEDSELSLPYYNLGLLYYAMDSTVAATEAYQTAIERPDPFPEIYYNLAQMMTYKKETLPAAARYISTYLKLQPYDEYGYLLAGSIHQDLAQLDRAKEYYDFALALAPDDKYVQWFYAHFLTESKEYNGALDLWLKSLEDFPNPSEINEAYKGVAICYANLDNSDAAISYLKKLFENEFRDYEQLSVEDNFSELAENPVFLQLMKQHFPDKY